jgi:hypothetical protein
MNNYIVVVGNFGSGQEVIMKFLNKKFKRLKINKELHFTTGNDFLSQMDILANIFKTVDANSRFFKNQTFVLDNHPTFIKNCVLPSLHSLNQIDSREVKVLREWIKLVDKQVKTLLVIHLKLDTNKCYDRLLNKNIVDVDFDTLFEMERQLNFWTTNSIEETHISIDMNYFLDLEFDERKEKELLRILLREFPDLDKLRI